MLAPRCALAALLLALSLPAQDPPTIMIDGRVTDVCGDPLRVAEVWVTTPGDPGGKPRRRTFADGQGLFRLRVPLQPEWHVHARLDAYEHAVRRVAGASLAEHLVFELRDAVTVRGLLRDAEQRAVAGQIVRAWTLADEELPAPIDATTDRDGRFELRDVAIGPQRLVAFVPGSGFTTRKLTVTEDCEVELAPTDPVARDSVTVRVSGIAVADLSAVRLRCGIRVRNRELALPPPHASVPFMPDGSLTLAGVYGGALTLRIDAPGHIVSPRTRWFDAGQPIVDLEFDATSRGSRALSLRGTLKSTAGVPLAGVDLAMSANDGSASTFATTGDDGSFVFRSSLPNGEPCVFRSLDGRFLLESLIAPGARHPRVLRCETWVKPGKNLTVRATVAATIHGTVRRPDGRPAEGIRVGIEEQMPEAGNGWFEVASATTDREGVYRSDRIHPGAKALRLVVRDSRGCGTSEPFQLVGQARRTGTRDLDLVAPFVVEGTLRGSDGTAQVAEGVHLARPGPLGHTRFVPNSRRTTDRRGRFRFCCPAEPNQWLRVWAKGAKSDPFEPITGTTLEIDLVRGK